MRGNFEVLRTLITKRFLSFIADVYDTPKYLEFRFSNLGLFAPIWWRCGCVLKCFIARFTIQVYCYFVSRRACYFSSPCPV